ncbi:conserved exported hypothetical protein [Flavobacterium sp. 9AF]|uniref:dihydroorotase n=1 Tax=Flavobacterium sp. 9AF TaxID=2653142 RepID=UPI0012F1A8DD|nr:dihydroorotase [Flavobacterium sp. 9AF]VXB79436.1 conserved exported hypothetical protein [Flavobacterium sp. 9AF]
MKAFYKFLILFLAFSFINTYSQEKTTQQDIKKVYVLKSVQNNAYQHIYFPKTNFIKKRGGFENYETLIDKKVIVTKRVKQKKDSWIVLLKLEDGTNFFGVYPTIEADLEKAIEKGELEIAL